MRDPQCHRGSFLLTCHCEEILPSPCQGEGSRRRDGVDFSHCRLFVKSHAAQRMGRSDFAKVQIVTWAAVAAPHDLQNKFVGCAPHLCAPFFGAFHEQSINNFRLPRYALRARLAMTRRDVAFAVPHDLQNKFVGRAPDLCAPFFGALTSGAHPTKRVYKKGRLLWAAFCLFRLEC